MRDPRAASAATAADRAVGMYRHDRLDGPALTVPRAAVPATRPGGRFFFHLRAAFTDELVEVPA